MCDVAVERRAVLVAQFADAALLAEIRMRQQIAADHDVATLLRGAWIGRDAADTMADISGVGWLAHLAVADNVDAGGHLLCYDLFDRLRGHGFEHIRRNGRALFPIEDHGDERLRPRQTAGMGGQDAVGGSFHRATPWSFLLAPASSNLAGTAGRM